MPKVNEEWNRVRESERLVQTSLESHQFQQIRPASSATDTGNLSDHNTLYQYMTSYTQRTKLDSAENTNNTRDGPLITGRHHPPDIVEIINSSDSSDEDSDEQ